MRALRGKKPSGEGRPHKPKLIIFGKAGVGKTKMAIKFPNAYVIDTEGGAEGESYQRELALADGAYMGKDDGSQDFATVIEEIKTLATTEHPFRTLVIDSFSKLYLMAAAIAEQHVGNDFGKDRKEANKPTRQLMLWIERLDMNVVLICHSKEKWVRAEGKKDLVSEGQTFDGWEKLEYDLNLCLEVTCTKTGVRQGIVRKTRYEAFPLSSSFPWTIDELTKRFGEGTMFRKPEPFRAATPEQAEEVVRLLGVVKLPADWASKCLSKAGVEAWEEMPGDKIAAVLSHLRSMVRSDPMKAPEKNNGNGAHKEPVTVGDANEDGPSVLHEDEPEPATA